MISLLCIVVYIEQISIKVKNSTTASALQSQLSCCSILEMMGTKNERCAKQRCE